MKKYLFLILFTLVSITLPAQNQKIINQISQVANSLKSMQADFVQTKHMKLLGDKMVSYGKMYYQQSDKLRWEYAKPYSYVFILNSDKVYLKKGNRKDVIDVNKNKVFKEITKIMMSSVVGNCLNDNKKFKISLSQSGDSYIATLIPQKSEMKQMYSKIVLTFNKKSSMISEVVMYEKNGDTTDITLKNVTVNKSISASYFAL